MTKFLILFLFLMGCAEYSSPPKIVEIKYNEQTDSLFIVLDCRTFEGNLLGDKEDADRLHRYCLMLASQVKTRYPAINPSTGVDVSADSCIVPYYTAFYEELLEKTLHVYLE